LNGFQRIETGFWWFCPICHLALKNKKAAWEAAFFVGKTNQCFAFEQLERNHKNPFQSAVKTKPPLRAVAQE
jgi:hypothetical protein